MNSVSLIGRMVKDPEVRYTQSNMAVCTFSIAIDRGKDKDGNSKGTDFPRITVFGRTAENVERYVKKGQQIAIQGHLQTGSYEDKHGNKVYTTDVIADKVEFIGNKSDNTTGGGHSNSGNNEPVPSGFTALDTDIPF